MKIFLNLILIISFTILSNTFLSAQCGSHPDYAPLMALYNSTGGSNWKNKTGWVDGFAGTNCNPCNNWYGVLCVNERVIMLFPETNNLNGPIPPELGALSKLTALILHSNKLNGSIPSELGNLTQLKILSLNSNMLNGTIPVTLGNLIQLEDFNVSNNSLIGCI